MCYPEVFKKQANISAYNLTVSLLSAHDKLVSCSGATRYLGYIIHSFCTRGLIAHRLNLLFPQAQVRPDVKRVVLQSRHSRVSSSSFDSKINLSVRLTPERATWRRRVRSFASKSASCWATTTRKSIDGGRPSFTASAMRQSSSACAKTGGLCIRA